MPALFKSIGSGRGSAIVNDSSIGDYGQSRNCNGRAGETVAVEDNHDLSFRSAAIIGQARQKAAVLFVGLSTGAVAPTS